MRVLDVCCGVGGASVGYARAGHEVKGLDVNYQLDYPYEFYLNDMLRLIPEQLREYEFVHISPPCQSQTALTKGTNRHRGIAHPNLIPQARDLLVASGVPGVIENVVGSEVRPDITLCGEMFGLGVLRHRVFEFVNCEALRPLEHLRHRGRVAGYRHGSWYDGPYTAVYGQGGGKGSVREWQDAMDIHWTNNRKSIAEAIPPAYTHWIGEQL